MMKVFAGKSRAALTLLIFIGLIAMTLSPQQYIYADVAPERLNTFRIGLHHGTTSLLAATLRYTGQVRFFMADFLENTIPIMEDDFGTWRIEREAVRLQVGPFAMFTEAQTALAQWPASLNPSFIVREGLSHFVVGGLFLTAEQALQGLPTLTQAGLTGQVRGQLFLVTDRHLTEAEAKFWRQFLLDSGISARLFFDSDFRLAVGRGTDVASLDLLRAQLSAAAPDLQWRVAEPDTNRMEVLRADGQQLFVFADLPRRALRAEIVQGQDMAMSIDGRMHRGSFEFVIADNNRMRVIGIMDVEDYLKGVVPREMPALWPLEALKAQAVVARTYAYANRNRHGADNFDLCALSTCCQAYGGVAWEHEASSRAVDETRGMIIFFNGRPATTFYHSDSGGHTENVENVWGGTPQSFLVGVPDPFPAQAGSTQTSWHTEITQQTMQNIVRHNRGDVGTILSVNVARRLPSGRVGQLVITGTRGSVSYTRQQPRLFDGSAGLFALRSTMYNVSANTTPVFLQGGASAPRGTALQGLHVATAAGRQALPVVEQFVVQGAGGTRTITAIPTSFVFSGSGWGHGVGMSQWGARGMAMAGHSFRAILLYYYRGVDLITLIY